jgi:DNA-binding NarL/FixJ family response regulator
MIYANRLQAIPSPVHIHIDGQNPFIHQSLIFLLKSNIQSQDPPIHWMPPGAAIDPCSGAVAVILIDCLERNRDDVQKQVSRYAAGHNQDIRIVLFNLGNGCRMNPPSSRGALWGCFSRDDSTADFVKGMQAILGGHRWLGGKRSEERAIPSPHAELPRQPLSSREQEVLQLMAAGLSNVEIAGTLSISALTVKTHVYQIYRKIQVPNRLQAVLWATANLTGR